MDFNFQHRDNFADHNAEGQKLDNGNNGGETQTTTETNTEGSPENVSTTASTEVIDTNNGGNQEGGGEQTTAQTNIQEVDYGMATDGLFKSKDEIKAVAEKLKDYETKLSQVPKIEPFEQKLIDFYRSGQNPYLLIDLERKDFDAMDAKAVLWEKFKLDNTDLSEQDANDLFEYEYSNKYGALAKKIDEDEASVEEIAEFKKMQNIARIALDKDAKKYRGELKKYRDEFIQKPGTQMNAEAEKQKAEQESWHNDYKAKGTQYLADMKGISVEMGGAKINLPVEPKSLEAIVHDPIKYFENALGKYFTEQGTNYEGLVTNLAALANIDKIVAEAIKIGKAQGIEETIKQAKNPSNNAGNNQAVDGEKKNDFTNLSNNNWSKRR